MSEDLVAGLITMGVIATLLACVPCLKLADRFIRGLLQASERQAGRSPWRSARRDEVESAAVFRRS